MVWCGVESLLNMITPAKPRALLALSLGRRFVQMPCGHRVEITTLSAILLAHCVRQACGYWLAGSASVRICFHWEAYSNNENVGTVFHNFKAERLLAVAVDSRLAVYTVVPFLRLRS